MKPNILTLNKFIQYFNIFKYIKYSNISLNTILNIFSNIFSNIFLKSKLFMVCFMILIISIISVPNLNAQLDKTAYYNYGTPIYAEINILPYDNNDTAKINILYKIQFNSLIFKKSTEKKTYNKFIALPQLEIVLKDKDGIIRSRNNIVDTVIVDNFEETSSKELYFSNFVESKVAHNEYKCSIEFNKSPTNVKLNFNINTDLDFYTKKNVLTTPIFISRKVKESSKYLLPFIMDKKIAFSSVDTGILIPISYENETSQFRYEIKTLDKSKKSIFYDENDKLELSGTAKLRLSSELLLYKIQNKEKNKSGYIDLSNPNTNFNFNPTLNTMYSNNVFYDIEEIKSNSPKFDHNLGILDITIPSNFNKIGKYELIIFYDENGTEQQKSYKFENIWETQPICLQNLDYAVESMYYILSDELYEKMSSGDEEYKRSMFLEYWKSKDPTKPTPFNEALYQYFSRVDYVFFNYQTLSQSDGSKTDQGKIFILYSKPDKTESKFNGNIKEEIWTYNKAKKRYKFSTFGTGLMKLTEIEDL